MLTPAEGDNLLAFAQALIAAPSPSPPGDERAVAVAELQRLGLGDVQVVGPRVERPGVLCRWDTGRPGPALILNGRLDTKPRLSREEWTSDPYAPELRDGRLYGLGAADMKGAVAALVHGLHAARQTGTAGLRGSVLLALTADEEGQAQDGARHLVEELGARGDAVLIAEPCGVTRDWECLPLVTRGYLREE